MIATTQSQDTIRAFLAAAQERPDRQSVIKLTRVPGELITSKFFPEELGRTVHHGTEIR